MRFIRCTLLPLLILAAVVARAQSVHWENDDNNPGSVVLLVFQDCAPDGDPQLPTIPNVTLSLAGRSQSMNVVNMSMSQTVTLSYVVQARRAGPLQIPAFTVATNKGKLQVPAFNGAAPSITADSVATSKLIPDHTSVWAGEVFGLTYELTAARRYNPQINPTFDWNPAPLVAEDWSKYEVSEIVVDGQRQAKLTYHTRAYAKVPNTIKLEAASHLIQVQTGSSTFGLFSQPRMEPVSVTSDQPTIEVRPLPAPPGSFSGAVGRFKLTSKVVPKEAAVGEPVTWTLELTGTGNWPDIPGLPAREVSKDFQVVQPKAKRTVEDGKLFDATLAEDVVLVPTKAGRYSLGPVAFTFFNPQSGSYETVRTDRVTITINPAPAAAANGTAPANGAATPSTGAEMSNPNRPPPAAPAAPEPIPHDPLPGRGSAMMPLTTGALILWLLAPLGCLVLFWLALAWRRATRTDPIRPQREASARLARLVADLRIGQDSNLKPSADSLLQWQRDTAVLWGVARAAPSAEALEQFGQVSNAKRGRAAVDPAVVTAWAALWRDTDRALYSAQGALPSDWVARAEAALAAKRVAGFNPARLFLPKNLLAFAAAAVLLLAVALPHTRAATPAPEVSYRAGDFAAAERAWREVVAQNPTDWIARHNLSLALAQLDRPAEAAAQAAAAFVQHPNEASVRWHLAYTAEKAGFAPGPLQAFLREGPALAIATLASPAGWQRILIIAAFGVAAALGWLLFNAYGRKSRARTWAGLVIGAIVTVVGIVAIFGVVAYGETADARAAISWQAGVLRSIPTEADTAQKTSSLPPGSIAIVDKTFLGNWDHLVFANGQTGWVRKEDVVPLWR